MSPRPLLPAAENLAALLMIVKKERDEAVLKLKPYRPPAFLKWFTLETQAYNRQQKCRHLKGAIGGPRGVSRDYNVAMHTFPTGETKIWCLSNCGWNVWSRPGWSFKWAIGMKMVEKSSNWPSASEVSGEMLKEKIAVPVRVDVGGGIRVVFHDRIPPNFGVELKPKENK